jgi:hypothetical protein
MATQTATQTRNSVKDGILLPPSRFGGEIVRFIASAHVWGVIASPLKF